MQWKGNSSHLICISFLVSSTSVNVSSVSNVCTICFINRRQLGHAYQFSTKCLPIPFRHSIVDGNVSKSKVVFIFLTFLKVILKLLYSLKRWQFKGICILQTKKIGREKKKNMWNVEMHVLFKVTAYSRLFDWKICFSFLSASWILIAYNLKLTSFLMGILKKQ